MFASWYRLVGTAVCCTGVLCAGTCDKLSPAPRHGTNIPESVQSLAFRLVVKPGGPAFRVTVNAFSVEPPKDDPLVHLGEIEVARCADAKLLQSLPLMANQSIDVRSFHAEDVNVDGYLDFASIVDGGATWASEQWWIFDPASGRFVTKELTGALRNLKAADYRIDPKKHEIRTSYLSLPWGCGPTGDWYKIANNRLILVHKEVPKPAGGKCTVEVSDLIGGAMRVTAVRRFADGKRVQ
jgi:hypothetical protein